MFANFSHFQSSLILEGKAGANYYFRVPLCMPANTRLGLNWLTLANTLAYSDMTIIIVVKSFIVQAPGYI